MLQNFHLAAFFIFFVGNNCAQIRESDLKILLNDIEWASISGHVSSNSPGGDKDDLCYAFLWTHLNTTTNHLTLESRLLPNHHLTVQLSQSRKLLSPEFAVVQRWSNHSKVFDAFEHSQVDDRCHYRGQGVALAVCGQIRGLLTIGEFFYTVHPLPKRVQALFKEAPYVLVQKPLGERSAAKNHAQCDTMTASDHYQKERKRIRRSISKTSSWSTSASASALASASTITTTNESRKELFVETAVFVDQDLFAHMKINYPYETEKELIRFVLAMINAVQLLYHSPTLGRTLNFLIKRLEILHEEPYGLNRSLDIDQYLSSFCNWQANRNKNNTSDSNRQHWDHALILTGLDLFVSGKNGKRSNQVVGLAPVAGMCTATSSCTVNEGRHFESVYVVAHEIGHNLGMKHDGPTANNDCDPSGFIMSPTLGSGKITWSLCSREYLNTFLRSSQSKCLRDHGSSASNFDHSSTGSLPGELFDADQQCALKYGNGSRHDSRQDLANICHDLHCRQSHSTWTSHPALEGSKCSSDSWCRGGKCILKSFLSLSSSSLRSQSKRHHDDNFAAESNVINDDRKVQLSASPDFIIADSLPFLLETKETDVASQQSWSDWKSSNKCYSSCLYWDNEFTERASIGITEYYRECLIEANSADKPTCSGVERKLYTCEPQSCEVMPRSTVRRFVDNICRRARFFDNFLNGRGYQKTNSDDEEKACTVWCETIDGNLKSHGWSFPDGTQCKLKKRRSRDNPTFCFQGMCKEFQCEFEIRNETRMHYIVDSDECMAKMTALRKRKHQRRRHTIAVAGSDVRKSWISVSGCLFNCIGDLDSVGFELVAQNGDFFRTNIRLCQPHRKNCQKLITTTQFANGICSDLKIRIAHLSGQGQQLLSSIDNQDHACQVSCRDERFPNRFYVTNGSRGWFPFGTVCSSNNYHTKSYCLRGKCINFGQNGFPLNDQVFSIPIKVKKRRRRRKRFLLN